MRTSHIGIMVCTILIGCSSGDKIDKVTTAKPLALKADSITIDDNGKLGDLFKSGGDEIGAVNKYLWQASLDVLSFLPINTADPFTGLIVFGKGRAPGSSQIYSANIFISDPALDARALRVVVRTSDGLASAETQREIENAILSRARELRIAQAKL